MKIHSLLLIGLLGLFSTTPLSAEALADIGGETEIGSDGKGGTFASQFIFYDEELWNGSVRYFWVNRAISRFEASIGPTLKNGHTTTKFSVGATNKNQVITILSLSATHAGRSNFYVADAKHSTNSSPSTLYQKLFVGIDRGGTWHAKVETLAVRRRFAFARLGIEYRIKLTDRSHFAVNPFYDPKVRSWGAMIDYRFW